MPKVAVTYSPEVGGASVISLKNSFYSVDCEVVDADFREMLQAVPKENFNKAYHTSAGRSKIFAHAKFAAEKLLDEIDCLVLSGNNAMIDPDLFNQQRLEGLDYDFPRTIAELALVHVATQRGMPIMGVCGGHQVVAVYGGGTIKGLNSTELYIQKYMNYDAIIFNANSMLKQIIGPNSRADTLLEQEFFGAHQQAVDKLGKGFVKTGVSSDRDLIEAAESEHGSPVITTQFHPEITVHGLPRVQFLYKKTTPEIETSLKIFDFFAKAGETYRNKKILMNEIKQNFKKIESPIAQEQKREARIKVKFEEFRKQFIKNQNIKKPVKKEEKLQIFLKKFTDYVSKLIDKVKSFFRTLIANIVTSEEIEKLKKQEQEAEGAKKKTTTIPQHKKIESTEKIIRKQIENSHQLPQSKENPNDFDSSVAKENKSPAEVMINEPARSWLEKSNRLSR